MPEEEIPAKALWSSMYRSAAWMALASAFLARALWAVLVPVVPISDSIPYDLYARTVANGHSYGMSSTTPGAFWPPGTSFLYAGLYELTGVVIPPEGGPYTPLATYASIEVVNVLLGVLMTLFTMMLGARLIHARAVLVAGYLVALWPLSVTFTSVLQSESPFTTLVLAGMTGFVYLKNRSAARAVACGVCFALAAYVRPTILIIPPLLFGVEFIAERTRARTFATALATGLIMAACIAPWTARNYKLFDTLVPISTNGGTNLWMGNNPKTTGYYMPFTHDKALNEKQNDDNLKKDAVAFIKKDPVAFAKRTLVKLVRLHERQTIGVVWNTKGLEHIHAGFFVGPAKLVSTLYWTAILLLGVVGVVVCARRRGVLRTALNPLFTVWACFAALYAVYVIQDRYTYPFTPLIACFAAGAICQGADWWRERTQKRLT
jgi:4-amino-4-deoxy-L-arabinose transferase-like glycosyltransferase